MHAYEILGLDCATCAGVIGTTCDCEGTTYKASNALFSSASHHWTTPEKTYTGLDAEFHFTMDPCPLHADFDGLTIPWTGSVFVNPPYGRGNVIVPWIKKGYESAQAGATVVMLLPSRTDTRWWHEYVMKGEIRFIQGRLHFSGTKFNAPFPSAVIIFRANKENT